MLILRPFPILASKLNLILRTFFATRSMQLSVYDILQSDSAIFHDEGLKVYQRISEYLAKNVAIELSFLKVANCSTQFLNACVGKAYMTFGVEKTAKLLTVSDYGQMPLFQSKLDAVVENVSNYDDYQPLVNSAMA